MITTEQQRAIDNPGPLCVIAGAGSGKTSVLTERYYRLLRQGLSPHRILAVTFTTDAATELRARIMQRTVELGTQTTAVLSKTPNIGTIHSFCYRVLRDHGSLISMPAVKKVMQPLEWYAALGEACDNWKRTAKPEQVQKIYDLFGTRWPEVLSELYRNQGLPPEDLEFEIYSLIREAFLPVTQALDKRLRLSGIYSFDDLEVLCLKILEDSAPTLSHYQKAFDAILIDEYQDTSRRQHLLFQKLIGTDPSRLFFVGDPKQSIYRFRQADVSLFGKSQEEVVRQGGETVELTQNFRSTSHLLQFFNQYSRKVFPSQPLLRVGRVATSNETRVCRYPSGAVRPQTILNEIRCVTEEIQALIDSGENPNDMAILFRASDRITTYQQALEDLGIPTRSRCTRPLFNSYGVVDIAAFLRAISNPNSDFHFAAFLRSNFVKMSRKDLLDLAQRPGKSVFEKALTDARVSWFAAWVEERETDLKTLLIKLMGHTRQLPDPPATLELIKTLLMLAPSVSDAVRLIDYWERAGVFYNVKTDQQGVLCATVHSVKGLEFKHVFLVDLLRQPPKHYPCVRYDKTGVPAFRYLDGFEWVNSPRYAALQEEDTANDLEESARVLYVAITRSRDTLTVFLPFEGAPKNSWAAILESLT